MGRRFIPLKRKHIKVGLPVLALIVGAYWVLINLPMAWGSPELHRGWEQPALSLVGWRYSVSYSCERGRRRRERQGAMTAMAKALVGGRFNHFLAWNHDDAIRFALSVEPDCRIYRLNHLTSRWFRGRYQRRYYQAYRVIGPEA